MLTERQSNCAGMDLPRVGTILFCVNSATALLYMGMGGISLDEDFLWEKRGQDQG